MVPKTQTVLLATSVGNFSHLERQQKLERHLERRGRRRQVAHTLPHC